MLTILGGLLATLCIVGFDHIHPRFPIFTILAKPLVFFNKLFVFLQCRIGFRLQRVRIIVILALRKRFLVPTKPAKLVATRVVTLAFLAPPRQVIERRPFPPAFALSTSLGTPLAAASSTTFAFAFPLGISSMTLSTMTIMSHVQKV